MLLSVAGLPTSVTPMLCLSFGAPLQLERLLRAAVRRDGGFSKTRD